MEIILYMAVSLDGYIAKKDGDSEWVSSKDTNIFEQKMRETGCIMVGNRTFQQYYGELYPVEDVTNIVLTQNKSTKTQHSNVIYASSPKEATSIAVNKKHRQALLIGGGKTNGLFLTSNLIDEIFLSVYPLAFGEGIRLFEHSSNKIKLKLLDHKEIGDQIIQFHYRVIK